MWRDNYQYLLEVLILTRIYYNELFIASNIILNVAKYTIFYYLVDYFNIKQDKPCTYNVTMRRVRATISAVEKQ